MPKAKSRRNGASDTKESRLVAAHSFTRGDRIRHQVTGKLGKFLEINLGFALPEVWIEFDSDTEIHIPLSCNPLLIELADKDGPQQQTVGESVLSEEQKLHESALQILSSVRELRSEPEHQSIDDAPPKRIAVDPEVSGELTADPGGHRLEVEAEEISKEVSVMAATIDETQVAVIEVVEELSEQELAERHRLELKVERAFVEAGTALRELRDRRLYRNTHKTFEEYCRDRFGFSRQNANYFIAGAGVVDNLLNLTTNCCQILPTKESQVRPLTSLNPQEQRQVWEEAVEASGGKIPSARVVKGIVERLKERHTIPPLIPFQPGEVVEIGFGRHSGCWGIVTHVGTWNCTIHISVRNVDVQCKPHEMEKVAPKYTVEIKVVNQRILALMQCDNLSRTVIAVVETLVRQTCFSPDDLWLLEKLEERYGLA